MDSSRLQIQPLSGVIYAYCTTPRLLRGGDVRLLADPVPNFFPVYASVGRRGDAQPDFVAFDCDDGDRQRAIRYQDSFADLTSENEHQISSLKQRYLPLNEIRRPALASGPLPLV
jgi:hypothetical protein